MAKKKIQNNGDRCLELSKQLNKIIETEYKPLLIKKNELETEYQELYKKTESVEKRISDTRAEINKLIK